MSEINPHIWHFTALLLHGDGKNCAPLDTPAHRTIYSVDNFHRFSVCILFTVHLMPIQRDFFQKDRFPCLDSSEEPRFANSYCKDTFKAHKNTAFFFFNRKQKYVKQHHRAHCNEIWNMGYWNLEAEYQIAKRLFLKGKCLRLFFSPTCGRIHWIANRIIQEHFGLRLQVSVECQSIYKKIKIHFWHSYISNTYYRWCLAQQHIYYVAHPVENNDDYSSE